MSSPGGLRRIVGPLLSVALLFSVLVPAPAAAQTKAEVERTQAERDAALERLREVNAELEEAVAEYQAITAELEDLTWRIARLFEQIQEYEAEVRDLKDRARELVLEAYMTGGGDLVQVAFEAGSIQDILTSQELIGRATAHDLVSLDRLQAVRREMERLKEQLEVDQARVNELRARAEVVVERLDELYTIVDEEFHEADDAAREAKKLFEIEEQKRRLLEQARRQGASAGLGSAVPSGFVCPLPGATFINDWGFPRSGGRTHKGTDMFAPRGTPLLATGDGTVRLRSNSLGGITVWLNADHGVSYYYAHLDSYPSGLATGQRVSAGQVIGYVGSSGNASYSAPHLHFQIHPNGGSPVNPYPTVSRTC